MIQTVNIKVPAFQAQTKIQKSEPQLTFKGMTSQDCFVKTAQPQQQVSFTGLGAKIKHALKWDIPKAMRKNPEIQGLATNAINNLDVEAFKTIESFAEGDKGKAREIGEVRAHVLDKVAESIVAPDAKPQDVNKKLEFLLKTGLAEDLTFDLIACKGKIDGVIMMTMGSELPLRARKSTYNKKDLCVKVLSLAMAETNPLAGQFKQEYVDSAKFILNKTQIDAVSTYREHALDVLSENGNIKDCLETLLAVANRKEIKAWVPMGREIPEMVNQTFEEEISLRQEAVKVALELLDKSDLSTTEREGIQSKLDAASVIVEKDAKKAKAAEEEKKRQEARRHYHGPL